jgi:hypothetical protein
MLFESDEARRRKQWRRGSMELKKKPACGCTECARRGQGPGVCSRVQPQAAPDIMQAGSSSSPLAQRLVRHDGGAPRAVTDSEAPDSGHRLRGAQTLQGVARGVTAITITASGGDPSSDNAQPEEPAGRQDSTSPT